MGLGQPENADGRSEALFRVRPVAHDDVDQCLGIGPDNRGLASDASRCPLSVTAMRTGHVFVYGGMSSIAGSADVRGDPFAVVEDLYSAICNPRPELLFGQGVGHRIIMLGDLDMVVEAGATLFPFGVLVCLAR